MTTTAKRAPRRSAASHARTYPFTTVVSRQIARDPFLTIRDLADNECPHGRLPGDKVELTDPCGCWRAKVSA